MKSKQKSREYVDSIEQLEEQHQVLPTGKINAEHVKGIADLENDNLDVVLTQPRWAYVKSKQDRREKLFIKVIVWLQPKKTDK